MVTTRSTTPAAGSGQPTRTARPATAGWLASHFFTLFPQLEGLQFSHGWAAPIDTSTRFCAFHGLARGGRVAYAAGFTGLGAGATRFAAEVMLDRADHREGERNLLLRTLDRLGLGFDS